MLNTHSGNTQITLQTQLQDKIDHARDIYITIMCEQFRIIKGQGDRKAQAFLGWSIVELCTLPEFINR